MPFTQGQILNNRYTIIKLLGQGGFGAVYKAWGLNSRFPCAVKENTELSLETQRQFEREARLLRTLRHPNLPLVFDYFLLPGQGQYLVMDYIEGEDLEQKIKTSKRYSDRGSQSLLSSGLPESEVIPWIIQVCDALTYLHSQNPPIIHRDIKPANIKIAPNGLAVLVDFGIAITYNPYLKTSLRDSAVTPGYSPPEQYGQGMTDARTDIYALAATTYAVITGVEPPESIARVVHDPLIPPRKLNPSISSGTDVALLRALRLAPEQRFQNAEQLKQALSSP